MSKSPSPAALAGPSLVAVENAMEALADLLVPGPDAAANRRQLNRQNEILNEIFCLMVRQCFSGRTVDLSAIHKSFRAQRQCMEGISTLWRIEAKEYDEQTDQKNREGKDAALDA